MGKVPSSNSPGYKKLRERADAALGRFKEEPWMEFKATQPWKDLKWTLTRTAVGMGNLRDGGSIIIGVSESGDWNATGINAHHLSSYDVDGIKDHMNSYISPDIKIDVVVHAYQEKEFLIISVSEFQDAPFLCRKDSPRDIPNPFNKGCVYIRPLGGRARTNKILDARDMHDLLELAAEKRSRRFLEAAKRLGMSIKSTDREEFNRELGGL